MLRIACEGKRDIATDDPLGVLHSSVGFPEPANLKHTYNLCEKRRHQFKIEKRRYFKEWLVNLLNVM